MAETFIDKHGYAQGTYEGQLDAAGHNSAGLIDSGKYGKNINPQEYAGIMSQYGNPYQEGQTAIKDKIAGVDDKMNELIGDEFTFDYTKFLPGIQKEAGSIYDPQQAQLQAMREFGQIQGDQAKVETNEQFDKRMQQETEAINNRGAYFSGGAVQNEQNIRTEQGRAINQITLQTQAADYNMQAQQALLTAEETKYIKDQLIDNQASAYNRWFNERGFEWGALSEIRKNYTDDKKYAQDVFNADRAHNTQVEQFKLNYDLNQKEFDLAKEKYKTSEEQWGEEMAFLKFKYFDAKANKKGTGSGTSDVDEGKEFGIEMADTVVLGQYSDPEAFMASAEALASLRGEDFLQGYTDTLSGFDAKTHGNTQVQVKSDNSGSIFTTD